MGGLTPSVPELTPVSYTHLDVYKRQTQITGAGIVGGFGTIGYDGDTVNMYVVDGEIRNGFLDDAYRDYMRCV